MGNSASVQQPKVVDIGYEEDEVPDFLFSNGRGGQYINSRFCIWKVYKREFVAGWVDKFFPVCSIT